MKKLKELMGNMSKYELLYNAFKIALVIFITGVSMIIVGVLLTIFSNLPIF